MYRVLYVDDEPALLDITKVFLEESGQMNVETHVSAVSALPVITKGMYDAIVSDYQMPGMDGIQFLKKVRESGNPVPFILFTGKGREEVVIQALNEGADFYLQKGGDPASQFAELSNKIRYAVNSRKAQETLRQSEEKYRRIVETSIEGIWSMDNSFTTVFINPRMAEMLGYTVEEMLGHKIMDFMDPGELADNARKLENRRKGQNDFYERKFRRKDGSIRWFSVSATSLINPDGSFAGSFAMLTDITDRKEALEALQRKNDELGAAYEQLTASEEELRQNMEELAANERALRASEEKYRRIVETSAEGIWSMDDRFTTVFINPRMAEMLGYTVEEMLGHKIMDFMDPGELADNARKLENRRKGQNDMYERKLRRKDGTIRWFGVSATSLKNPDGSFAGSFAMLTDITDRKEALEALQRKNDELGAAYEQLTASEEELRQNMEELAGQERALRASEEKYRDLFENAILGIFRSTPDGRYLEVNPAFARIAGYASPREMMEEVSDIASLYARPEDRTRLKEIIARDGEVSHFEAEIRHTGGSMIWISINARGYRDATGTILWYDGTIEDVTARHRAEQELTRCMAPGNP